MDIHYVWNAPNSEQYVTRCQQQRPICEVLLNNLISTRGSPHNHSQFWIYIEITEKKMTPWNTWHGQKLTIIIFSYPSLVQKRTNLCYSPQAAEQNRIENTKSFTFTTGMEHDKYQTQWYSSASIVPLLQITLLRFMSLGFVNCPGLDSIVLWHTSSFQRAVNHLDFLPQTCCSCWRK